MKNWLSVLFFFLLLMLPACARTPVTLDSVLILNATGQTITAVKVLHEPTGKFGTVNAILPEKSLDIGLPGRQLLARQASVRWLDGAGVEHSVLVDLPYDQDAAEKGRPVNLVYMIYPSGEVTVALQPITPGQ